MAKLDSVYQPQDLEERIGRLWRQSGAFGAKGQGQGVFSMVLPPPNVTGVLHLGHALDITLPDVLVRYHRMRGVDTVWIPGTDHAGIATQAKVEQNLREQGLSRHAMGREGFLQEVWAWKEQSHATITEQIRRLGASVDWDRERFTLDEGCSRAVRTAFVRLYNEGMIYRGRRIIQWCPQCLTALSDIEVVHLEEEGHLYHLAYPAADGDGHVVVATTRPETMLGDTAVAVHPNDQRYAKWIGRQLVLPLNGRRIEVVADEAVEMDFGTGAVKVTPFHDPTDFAIGERHNLEHVQVIDHQGRMTEAAGPFSGLLRDEARQQIVHSLRTQGVLVNEERHIHAVGHCERCGTVVEPMESLQWFVRGAPLAEPAVAALRDGRLKLVPERFDRVWLHWLENIRDWCISRQLWWGHRIPAWYCSCGKMVVAEQPPQQCPECGGVMAQDEDVLDTWFSSALWPFSTLGWPEQTQDLARYYPTSVLCTGYDILFFWVARMVMQGLHLTGEVPFQAVLLHGLVRDAKGRKMSKSLGNGVDPMEVVTQYGADALRYALMVGVTPGNDFRFYEERVIEGRNLANKLWNAGRLVLAQPSPSPQTPLSEEFEDLWIQSRLSATLERVEEALAAFDVGEAAKAAQEFFWLEFCDVYLELCKGRTADLRVVRTLQETFKGILALLHPFYPFVTEALWQETSEDAGVLAAAVWPRKPPRRLQVESDMQELLDALRTIRNLRAEVKVPPAKRIRVIAVAAPESRARLEEHSAVLTTLARLEELELLPDEAPKPKRALFGVTAGAEFYLPLEGVLDIAKELVRLEQEIATLQEEWDKGRRRMEDATFVARAPAPVVEKQKQRVAELEDALARARARTELLS